MGRCRVTRAIGLLSISLAALVSGCAENASSPASFEAALDPLVCRHRAECGLIGKSEESSCATDRAADRAAFPTHFERKKAIASNRIAFDSGVAQSCLAALQALIANDPCTPWNTPEAVLAGPSCRDAFRGLVPTGADCLADAECAAGYCDEGYRHGCGGTCKPFIATGDPCPSGIGCLPDDACDQFGAIRTCRPVFRPGDPPGTARRVAAGELCVSNLSCLPGLVCSGPLAWNGKNAYLGHCATPGDVGQSCFSTIQFSGCAGDLVCDQMSGTCLAPGREGADCSYYGLCREHFYCAYPAKKCVAKAAYGAPCNVQRGDPCDLGYCQQGACSYYCG